LPAAEALAIEKDNVRTVRLRLLPTPEQERELEGAGRPMRQDVERAELREDAAVQAGGAHSRGYEGDPEEVL